MKFISRFITSLLLLSLSLSASSQDDSLFATYSVYKCGIHYILVFKYKPLPDSIKTRIVKLRYQTEDTPKDSVTYDTLRLRIFRARAILQMEVPEGTEQLTDPTPVILVQEQRGLTSNFLQNAFDKLCNQSKKQFSKPPPPAPQATVPGHSEHWKLATKRSDNSFWMIGNENKGGTGDTIVLSGKYSYGYISQDYSSDVVIYTDGKQVTFKSGINIENTNHLRIDGSGGDSYYGILINGGGTNFAITGKSNYIDVGYIDMRNGGVGGLWDKTEASDVQNKYACDLSYLYPTRALYHHLHHIRLVNIQGDALYEGSTGSTGGRPMTCGGETTYPKPMFGGFVEIDHFVMDSINRQGGQISGCDTGYILVHDNTITNTGYEYNSQQGAGFSIGGLCKDAKVYKNVFHHTFLYNFYSYGDGATEFYDNVTDTAGQVGTKGTKGWKANPQQIPATLFAPKKPKSSLVIKDNITGYNTSTSEGKPVGYAIYGDSKIFSVGGNIFCNNVGNLQNAAGVSFETTCSDKTYTITASVDANTVITPPDITVVNEGGSQEYSIVANKGYSIADVKVDGVSIGAAEDYIFTNVKANHTISATSGSKSYNIIASSSGGGTVSPPGNSTVTKGSDITYTITPSSGWHTESLLVDNVPQDNSLTTYIFKNVKADHTIEAVFATSKYTITSSASKGGSITPKGNTRLDAGESQTYIFRADAGYEVSNVIVDGTPLVGGLKSYTFADVMADHVIQVNYTTASGPNLPPVSQPEFRARLSEQGTATFLDADSSYDPDGNIVAYKWEQVTGDPVKIEHTAGFATRVIGLVSGSYQFKLTVTDNAGDSNTAAIIVLVTAEKDNASPRFGIKLMEPSVKK